MADFIGSEVVTELVKQLFVVSRKAYMRRGIAENLATMIDEVQPLIQEILDSGVEMSHHRQNQLHMFFYNLQKCRMLTEKVLRCNRWNMLRLIYYVRKLEDLDKKISSFVRGPLSIHVLADVHHLRGAVDRMNRNFEQVTQDASQVRFDIIDRSADIHHVRADSEVRFDRIDRSVDSLNEKLGSMKIRGSESMREVMKMEEATTEMATDGDLGNLGVGLELGKRKVKEMLFKCNDEERLIGISGMSGSGKTTLAKELAQDEEVRGHFGNKVLFLTVSQSPNLMELRALIWGFLTGYEAASGAILPVSIGQTRKLVILDDVWTRESLDQLLFENIPGTTILVVSRSKLADSRATYDVELLNEHEATSLFCLPAFNQKSVPSGFSRSLVKQVVGECKDLPLSLKVVGDSLSKLNSDKKSDRNPKEVEIVQAEARDRYTEFSTGNYGAKPESSSSDAKTNTDLLDRTFSNSRMDGKVKPPKIQVFINFRGDQLRNSFIGYLVDALRRSEINVFIDNHEQRGEDLNTLFKRIEHSGIAIVVFSSRYTESEWCLDELVKIKERVHQGLLKVLPIFYKVTPTNVKRLKGVFGDHFRDKEHTYESDEPMIKRWKEAIMFVSHKFALTFDEKSVLEIDFVETIVNEVLEMLQAISKVESGQSSR